MSGDICSVTQGKGLIRSKYELHIPIRAMQRTKNRVCRFWTLICLWQDLHTRQIFTSLECEINMFHMVYPEIMVKDRLSYHRLPVASRNSVFNFQILIKVKILPTILKWTQHKIALTSRNTEDMNDAHSRAHLPTSYDHLNTGFQFCSQAPGEYQFYNGVFYDKQRYQI